MSQIEESQSDELTGLVNQGVKLSRKIREFLVPYRSQHGEMDPIDQALLRLILHGTTLAESIAVLLTGRRDGPAMALTGVLGRICRSAEYQQHIRRAQGAEQPRIHERRYYGEGGGEERYRTKAKPLYRVNDQRVFNDAIHGGISHALYMRESGENGAYGVYSYDVAKFVAAHAVVYLGLLGSHLFTRDHAEQIDALAGEDERSMQGATSALAGTRALLPTLVASPQTVDERTKHGKLVRAFHAHVDSQLRQRAEYVMDETKFKVQRVQSRSLWAEETVTARHCAEVISELMKFGRANSAFALARTLMHAMLHAHYLLHEGSTEAVERLYSEAKSDQSVAFSGARLYKPLRQPQTWRVQHAKEFGTAILAKCEKPLGPFAKASIALGQRAERAFFEGTEEIEQYTSEEMNTLALFVQANLSFLFTIAPRTDEERNDDAAALAEVVEEFMSVCTWPQPKCGSDFP